MSGRDEQARNEDRRPVGPGLPEEEVAKGDDAVEAVPHDVPVCDLCGSPMRESHCKLICDRCGYTRDCSDP